MISDLLLVEVSQLSLQFLMESGVARYIPRTAGSGTKLLHRLNTKIVQYQYIL
jgi:hypothetical protein